MKYLQDIGFEFEIGSPWAISTTVNKIRNDLGITGLKSQVDMTVETNHKYNSFLIVPCI